jgi:hypothetical protein
MMVMISTALRLGSLALLLLAGLSRNAAAQRSGSQNGPGATISGVVHDSISGSPLAGATVQVVPRDDPAALALTGVSDSIGRYLVKDVPIGTYRVGFFHPMLDSLGIEAPLREVHVDSYGPVIADLSVPSPARFRSAVCGGRASGDAGGLIIGNVRDARDGSPAAKVTVSGEWLEFALNRLGMARQAARRTATTTETGWFALCDVPMSGTVVLVATKGADSTGILEVEMPPGGFLRRELYLGPVRLDSATLVPQAGNTTATGKRIIHVGNGRLTGTIVSVASTQPLADAQVTITGGPQTRTNARGEFTLANAPSGTRMLEVRALGYFPVQRQVNVVTGAPPLRIALSTFKAVLDTVRITASRLPFGPDNGGFQRRRKMGLGKFITPADMLRFPVITTTDVFNRIAGVTYELDDAGQKKFKIRGCDPAIFLNGANMSFMDGNDIDTWVRPSDIAGIEVYSETTMPAEFQVGLRGCGAIVIWTR